MATIDMHVSVVMTMNVEEARDLRDELGEKTSGVASVFEMYKQLVVAIDTLERPPFAEEAMG